VFEDMTAIAVVYHPSGFALSADGRFMWGEKPAPVASEHDPPVDAVRKIFPFTFKRRTAAFALTGADSNNLGTFSVVSEMMSTLEHSGRTCQNIYELASRASRHVKDAVENARADGRLPKRFRTDPGVANEDGTFTICRIFIVGYFSKKKPTLVRIHLFHANQVMADPALHFETPPAHSQYSGSTIIYQFLFESTDERFAQYRKELYLDSPIEDVVEVATGYVKACCDPVAVSLDPLCRAIGGHVHSAKITQRDGFQWVVAPLTASAASSASWLP